MTRWKGTESIIRDAQESKLPYARLAVIVGTNLNPSETRQVNGITVRTLWGDIAAQLGGQEGYAIVRAADEKGVAPGAHDLVTLFNQFGPAVILIDELIAYVRNIYGVSGLSCRFLRRQPDLCALPDGSGQTFRTKPTGRLNPGV